MKFNQLPILVLIIFISESCTKAQQPREVIKPNQFSANSSPLKYHLGINAFEWNFSNDNETSIAPQRLALFQSFGGFRHYMDWDKLETTEGQYSFNPTRSGGWNYDEIYKNCKEQGIPVLACLKTCPKWLVDTYPKNDRDAENVPAPYGSDRLKPASYIKQAKVAFQYAARYGRNKRVPAQLLSVNATPRWNDDPINQIKIGLDYVHYIECDNERDKNWKGPKAYQSPEEYAANMSAFYDGDKGRLGKNVGVKNADPTMKVVMGGLSNPDINYVLKMIAWCKKNRGLNKDGSVNLCFDVINYHLYSNDRSKDHEPTRGKAPELSSGARIADDFVTMAKKNANGMEVWITEAGYDLNPASPQRAIAIGNKTALITQADWMIRSAFMYIRHGLQRSFFYMLEDVDAKSTTQYASSGFIEKSKKRPVSNYFFQTKTLLGNFTFAKNLNSNPIVDLYVHGKRKIYVVYIPDEIGRKKTMNLDLGNITSAKVYTINPASSEMSAKVLPTVKGQLKITATETPVFIEEL